MLLIVTVVAASFLTRSDAFVQAQSPPQSINGQITRPLDVHHYYLILDLFEYLKTSVVNARTLGSGQ
jgi:hypothetical protein